MDLCARGFHHEKIDRILYSTVHKRYSEYVEPDVWFDMVTYISDPNDGVRSYYEKYHWLERFILPFDPENSREVSDDFQGARVEFELRPGEFIEHIEKLSQLLKTRDLCKELLNYFSNETHDETRDWKVRFWTELYARILGIMGPPKFEDGPWYDSQSSYGVELSLKKYRDSNPGEPYSSAAGQLQKFWARSINDEVLKKEEESK